MAQELTVYFDERFREFAQKIVEETTRQIAASREETTRQIAASREETARQFAASREETSLQIAKLREEMISRFEKGEETARHTEILIEDLRHKLDVVAEGVVGANERLDRYRSEARIEFNQVKGWIEPYFRDLDGRVRNQDGRIDGVDSRLQVLEKQAERQQGDVYDAIRKMLGKPPLPPPVTSE
jgi:hypothetical protein